MGMLLGTDRDVSLADPSDSRPTICYLGGDFPV